MNPLQADQVIADLDVRQHYEFLDDRFSWACKSVHNVLYKGEEKITETMNYIKKETHNISRSNPWFRRGLAILEDLGQKFVTWQPETIKYEATIIIDRLSCFMSKYIHHDQHIKHEWSAYHLLPPPSLEQERDTLQPDYVAYIDPISTMNFELLTMEVKRSDKQTNKFEPDLVRLGKQLQTMLDKLIYAKVKEPVVAGLLIVGYEAIAYRMDLRHSGQYRLVEISRFEFPSKTSHILLLPDILEKLRQIK
ncbi:hypothetical protein DFQ28_001216, partial [Apophysomyces sp. BC1034]